MGKEKRQERRRDGWAWQGFLDIQKQGQVFSLPVLAIILEQIFLFVKGGGMQIMIAYYD
jgi:hypothetical protein